MIRTVVLSNYILCFPIYISTHLYFYGHFFASCMSLMCHYYYDIYDFLNKRTDEYYYRSLFAAADLLVVIDELAAIEFLRERVLGLTPLEIS
jgi:hypothetical protein